MQNNAGHTYKTAINAERMYKYALKMHKNCGHVSALEARRSDNNDDKGLKASNHAGLRHFLTAFFKP